MQILFNLILSVETAAFAFFIFCFGTALLSFFNVRFKGNGEQYLFSSAAGLAVFSLYILVIGKFVFLNQSSLLIFTLIAVVAAALKSKEIRDYLTSFKPVWSGKPDIFIMILLFLSAPRIFYMFFQIFIPSISWDVIAYHHAIPDIYLNEGRVVYIPFMFHANWPQNMEMLFTYAMSLVNDNFANGISFIYALILLFGIYLSGKNLFSKRTGVIAFALILAMSIVKREAVNGYVDVGLSMFELTAFFAVALWMVERDVKYLVAGAFAAGGAASVKILGLFSPLFLSLFILFSDYIIGREEKKLYFRYAFMFGIISLAILSPWYIKSYIDTGNPVWPFAFDLFGGKNWSAELSDFRSIYYAEHGNGRGFIQFLMLPYTLIVSGNMDGYIGNNVILYLLLLPYAFYVAFKEKGVFRLFLIYGTVFLIFWFVTGQMIRFLFPGFVIGTIMFSYLIDRILRSERRFIVIKIIAFAFVIFLVLYSYPFRHAEDFDGVKLFAGIEGKEKFIESRLDNYKLIKRINSDTGVDGKIVFFREIRGYRLKKEYIWGDPTNQGLIGYKSTESTLADLKRNKVGFILYNNNIYKNAEGDGFTGKVYEIMSDIVNNYSELMYCENNVCLYKINSKLKTQN